MQVNANSANLMNLPRSLFIDLSLGPLKVGFKIRTPKHLKTWS